MNMNMNMLQAPAIPTTDSMDSQQIMMQAMLANLKPEQQASVQQALALQARKMANRRFMRNSIRKIAPALTNGAATQNYLLGTPLTFNLSTANGGFCEGLIVKLTVNYTLAVGTSAVYGLTAAGILGLIDTIEVRYGESQNKIRPQILRELALMGLLEDYVIPESILAGQSQARIQSYLNTGLPVTTGANTATIEFFVPFNLLSNDDDRGVLPIIVGDTQLQVIVNTPQAIFGSDPILTSLYAVSGSGHAVSAVSGTVGILAVYRDGDNYQSSMRLPFDLSVVNGTFQSQIDTVLQPLIANSYQRTRLTIMGQHVAVVLLVVDGLQSNNYATDANIQYVETVRDGVGGNTFERYGLQTNLDYRDKQYLERLDNKQDMDQGVIPIFYGPNVRQGDPHLRMGRTFLDNTRNGWPDWRYAVNVAAVGTGILNGLPCNPRIEPHVFFINPTGLIPQ